MEIKGTFRLKRGSEKQVQNRHAWIFSHAIESLVGVPKSGDCVRVETSAGDFIGYGHYSGSGVPLAVRLLSWTETEVLDAAFFERHLAHAVALRAPILTDAAQTNCVRLVFSEGDFLPGLIVDRMNDTLVFQIASPGMERLKSMLAGQMLALCPDCVRVIEKSESDGRKQAHMEQAVGLLCGAPIPPEGIAVCENGFSYNVDLNAQKGGFYTDQRENRLIFERYARAFGVRHMADVCSYTGSFALAALRAGAESAVLMDVSQEALRQAERNVACNGFSARTVTYECARAFDAMRRRVKLRECYDAVVLDPPKLSRSKAGKRAALSAYKDLNLQAMKLLRSGGLLATFSCSGNVTPEDLLLVLNFAAKDAQKTIQIITPLNQGADHPVAGAMGEGRYLKGYLCRVWSV